MTGMRRAVGTLRGSAVKIPSTSFHICNSVAPRPAARSAAARSVYPRPTCFNNEPGTGPKKPVNMISEYSNSRGKFGVDYQSQQARVARIVVFFRRTHRSPGRRNLAQAHHQPRHKMAQRFLMINILRLRPATTVLKKKLRVKDKPRERTRSLSTAVIILQPSFSPKPTMLSFDLGEISSMTCRTPKLQRRVSHIRGPIGWRTCVADKNALKLSQSLIISDSNSARSVFPLTQSRAAVICSDWIRSTVLLNDTVHGSVNALNGPGGEPVRELRQIRESVSGVAVPDCTGDETAAGRRRASDAAR